MLNELPKQVGVPGDDCGMDCSATSGRAGQEDEEKPGDTSIEAR